MTFLNTFKNRFTWNNLIDLFLKRKKKFINLSSHDMKQEPKQLNEKFNKVILSNEFKINKVDKYVYIKNANKSYIIVYLYIDDMLILERNNYIIKSTKKMLTNKFHMKDLDVANIILGKRITKMFNGLVLTQSYYAEKLISKFFER
jgi:hypothetical protein